MITKQDIIDSFIPWRPTRYIKARLKIVPFVLVGALLAMIIGFLSGVFNFFLHK